MDRGVFTGVKIGAAAVVVSFTCNRSIEMKFRKRKPDFSGRHFSPKSAAVPGFSASSFAGLLGVRAMMRPQWKS